MILLCRIQEGQHGDLDKLRRLDIINLCLKELAEEYAIRIVNLKPVRFELKENGLVIYREFGLCLGNFSMCRPEAEEIFKEWAETELKKGGIK